MAGETKDPPAAGGSGGAGSARERAAVDRAHPRARVFALLALAATLALVSRGVNAAYHAATDSFVAPLIFSPDSDAVIQNRMTINRLVSERQDLTDRVRELEGAIQVDDEAIRQLSRLVGSKAAESLLDAANARHAEMEAALRGRADYLTTLEKDFAAGLTVKSEVTRETAALHQARAALMEGVREQLSGNEQITRLKLDLLKTHAERQGKAAQLASSLEALRRMDELMAQVRERPLFRAVEQSQNVAFVPYKELEGVRSGGTVYHCRMWGFLSCAAVGTVSEILPGEVVTLDPWGSSSRGQYAVLDLADPTAAKARSLRVRPGDDRRAAVTASVAAREGTRN